MANVQKWQSQGDRPVWNSVVYGADGGVSLVIQVTVWHTRSLQECPHIGVTPVQDGVHSHERWPASTAGTERLLTIRVGIAPAASSTLLLAEELSLHWSHCSKHVNEPCHPELTWTHIDPLSSIRHSCTALTDTKATEDSCMQFTFSYIVFVTPCRGVRVPQHRQRGAQAR